MEAFIKDLKHSLRMFMQSPAFTLAAVAALTLGIGANTAIFSVVNAVLLKPVAVPDPDHVIAFINVSQRGPAGPAASPAKFAHYRLQTEIVQDASAFNTGVMNFTGGTFPEQLKSGRVSADFFKLTGAPLLLGRGFTAEEDMPNGPRVTVIDRHLWETRFNADPNIVGKSISLGGEPYTIVGVLGNFDFREFGPTPQVWTLFQFDPNTKDQGHYFQVAGPPEAGRHGAAGQHADGGFGQGLPRQVPAGARPAEFVRREDDPRHHRARRREELAADLRRRRELRAADRLRQRRQPPARPRDRTPPRDRDPRRDRRIARPHHPAAADRERRPLAGRRRAGPASSAGPASARCSRSTPRACRASARTAPTSASTGASSLFTVVVSIATGIIFGLIPALQSSKTDLTTTLKESAGRSGTGSARTRRGRSWS